MNKTVTDRELQSQIKLIFDLILAYFCLLVAENRTMFLIFIQKKNVIESFFMKDHSIIRLKSRKLLRLIDTFVHSDINCTTVL